MVLRRGSIGTWVTGGSGISDDAADTAIWYTGPCGAISRWERLKGSCQWWDKRRRDKGRVVVLWRAATLLHLVTTQKR
jgi:hypothetical protein